MQRPLVALALAATLALPFATRAEAPAPGEGGAMPPEPAPAATPPDPAPAAAPPAARDRAAELLARAQEERRRAGVEGPRAPAPEDPVAGGLPMLLGGLLVAGGLLAAAAVVRRRRAGALASGGASGLKVVESTWIGRGQRLVLVSVEGRRLLLGVTPSGISTLASFEAADGATLPPAAGGVKRLLERAAAAEEADFAALVKDELAESARPARDQRRRGLEELGRL